MTANRLLPLILAGALSAPGLAAAAPDVTDSATIVQPDGAFTAVKTVQIFQEGNPDDPFAGDGRFTYVYTLANDAGSALPLIGFTLEIVPACPIATIGFFPATGVDPDAPGGVIAGNEVEWNFFDTSIQPGQVSSKLYVTSVCGPSGSADSIASVSGELSFDASGTCLAPRVPPVAPVEPMPCTIGFWKNRADGKKGTTQWFPGSDFTNVVAHAVALSGGVFPDTTSLLTSLGSKGSRSLLERGKQQLSATLLNLAAGDLFPDNQKCKLDEANKITSNQCGSNLTVGTAVNSVKADPAAGHSCADDINNGIGVIQ